MYEDELHNKVLETRVTAATPAGTISLGMGGGEQSEICTEIWAVSLYGGDTSMNSALTKFHTVTIQLNVGGGSTS